MNMTNALMQDFYILGTIGANGVYLYFFDGWLKHKCFLRYQPLYASWCMSCTLFDNYYHVCLFVRVVFHYHDYSYKYYWDKFPLLLLSDTHQYRSKACTKPAQHGAETRTATNGEILKWKIIRPINQSISIHIN